MYYGSETVIRIATGRTLLRICSQQMSFHADKCCYLVSEHEASAVRLSSSVRQFLIYSTFVLVRRNVAIQRTISSSNCDIIVLRPVHSRTYTVCRKDVPTPAGTGQHRILLPFQSTQLAQEPGGLQALTKIGFSVMLNYVGPIVG